MGCVQSTSERAVDPPRGAGAESAATQPPMQRVNNSLAIAGVADNAKWNDGSSGEDSFKVCDKGEKPRRSLIGNLLPVHVANHADTNLVLERSVSNFHFSHYYDTSDARVLGAGMSGQVTTARHLSSGIEYAVKKMPYSSVEDVHALRSEISAMRRLDHPNIIRLHEVFEDQDTLQITLVMDLCSGGSLNQWLKTRSEKVQEFDAALLVYKMLKALCHCHEHGVVHRDIKLANFCFESEAPDAELKMIDFGLSRVLQSAGQLMQTCCGTIAYMAPEVAPTATPACPFSPPLHEHPLRPPQSLALFRKPPSPLRPRLAPSPHLGQRIVILPSVPRKKHIHVCTQNTHHKRILTTHTPTRPTSRIVVVRELTLFDISLAKRVVPPVSESCRAVHRF